MAGRFIARAYLARRLWQAGLVNDLILKFKIINSLEIKNLKLKITDPIFPFPFVAMS